MSEQTLRAALEALVKRIDYYADAESTGQPMGDEGWQYTQGSRDMSAARAALAAPAKTVKPDEFKTGALTVKIKADSGYEASTTARITPSQYGDICRIMEGIATPTAPVEAAQQREDSKDATNARRYEAVRKLTPSDFTDLYVTNLRTNKPFDDLIDAIAATPKEST